MSTTFQHPWYQQAYSQENTTTLESPSKVSAELEELGLIRISEDFNELAFLAGIFEGEGSLSYNKRSWQFKIDMADKDIIDRCVALWDLSTTVQKPRKEHYKTQYRACTYQRDKIFAIICDIYPYLGARRREKCDEFLKWYADKTGQRYD